MKTILSASAASTVAFLTAALFLAVTHVRAVTATDDITVDGSIVDSKGQPLAGAKIMLLPDGKGEPHTITADAKGQYTFSAPPGLAFDLIYSYPGAGMATLNSLARSHDQHIHKVLFLGGDQVKAMTADQVYAELESFDRVTFLAAFRPDAGESIRQLLPKDVVQTRLKLLGGQIQGGDYPTEAAAVMKDKLTTVQMRLDKLPIKP